MLNIEKYKDKLENLGVLNPDALAVIDGKPCMCQETECDMCELYNAESCYVYRDNWLFSEYKEPEIDWSKVKVDTPILVKRSKEAEWERRYFARFKNGEVYAFPGGVTSWTMDDEEAICSWEYAKLAESEK